MALFPLGPLMLPGSPAGARFWVDMPLRLQLDISEEREQTHPMAFIGPWALFEGFSLHLFS